MENNIMLYPGDNDVTERLQPYLTGENIDLVEIRDPDELYERLGKHRLPLLLFVARMGDRNLNRNLRLIEEIRKRSNTSLIVLDEQPSDTAGILALNAGADDYVRTDCNPLELLARLKCQLWRYHQMTFCGNEMEKIYRLEGLEVDDIYRTVRVDGKEVRLTPREYEILRLLMRERGNTISVQRIYETVWHMRAHDVDNTIAVHVRHIREKIEKNPRKPHYLKAIWGAGYKVG